ncbi:copper resistance CopC family protein [Oerskovia flava]|uniref:copper resistance CopC family protein n=1 Tax=Oerskovia flava TaxID=2986422 RepID=UPI00223ECF17|nr:copper resistance CopC family protein [Oerskovia sp. JB1-3-2]
MNTRDTRTTRLTTRNALAAALALALALGMAFATVLTLAAPASAHDRLISSDPADGAELADPPSAITLTFNTEPLDVEPRVIVTDAAGETVAEGAPTMDGTDAVLALPDALPGGAYSVAWRVVSSDGHPIEGTFAFDVAEQAEPATEDATETPAETESPAEETPSETAQATETGAPAETPAGTDGSSSDDGGSVLPIVAGVGGVLVVAAVATVLVLRRRAD